MKPHLLKIRYYLEIISLPAFIYLVIHLAGHGVATIKNINSKTTYHEAGNWLNQLLSFENLIGCLLLILFVWIWYRPTFKNLVPCSHEHCHAEARIPHILAIIALCLHFFPESVVRSSLLNEQIAQGNLNLLAILGFGSHFLVDVIIAIIISSYWQSNKQFSLSLAIISAMWLLAYFSVGYLDNLVTNPYLQGMSFILSSFILSMFIHKPHKPVVKCHSC